MSRVTKNARAMLLDWHLWVLLGGAFLVLRLTSGPLPTLVFLAVGIPIAWGIERGVAKRRTRDRTVLDRALNGRDLAQSALGGGRFVLADYEGGLTDALANLMHFARRFDLDFEHAVDVAGLRHTTEARYGWDEVPQ